MGGKSQPEEHLAVDLFGDPVPRNRGGRGRPEHVPTQENRDKVTMLLAMGWANKRIASALSITQPTLRRHYKFQLKLRDEQRDRMDAAYAMRLWAQVEKGNVGAMRLWLNFVGHNDAAVSAAAFTAPSIDDEIDDDKPGRLGKKEQAARAATTAGEGTAWGDDLKPRAH